MSIHTLDKAYYQNRLKQFDIDKSKPATPLLNAATHLEQTTSSWLKTLKRLIVEILKWLIAYLGVIGLLLIIKLVTA